MRKQQDITRQLIDNLHLNLGVDLVFGEPIAKKNLTIIPVAKIKGGVGYGFGQQDTKNNQEGQGGGAGVIATPIGYIEINEHQAKFKKINSSHSLLNIAVTSLLLVFLLKWFSK